MGGAVHKSLVLLAFWGTTPVTRRRSIGRDFEKCENSRKMRKRIMKIHAKYNNGREILNVVPEIIISTLPVQFFIPSYSLHLYRRLVHSRHDCFEMDDSVACTKSVIVILIRPNVA